MTQKLNQVLAVERQAKSKAHSDITRLHKATLKPQLFNGFSKTYAPLSEDGEKFPPETVRVQMNAQDTIKSVRRILSDLFDLTATKDSANQGAKADLVVDGDTLLKDVPATTLLFLEKQLTDINTFVQKLPVLDPAKEWAFDSQASLWKTPATQTTKSKKIHKALVLHPPTDNHPAQTQMILEDVLVGNWTSIGHSGALTGPEKGKILERIGKLQRCVKAAREVANLQEAPQRDISGKVFEYLFGK
jgi:hypothetical protein